MNPYSTPSGKPKTSYVFHVVIQINGIYSPVATMIEMPPNDELWMRVSALWVAEHTRLIYEFLSNKDPQARFKLQTEVDLATEQYTRDRFWFRHNPKELCGGPHTATPRMRAMAMGDLESIVYPYTTYGIQYCLKEQGAPGVDGDNETLPKMLEFWTPGSLKTLIEMDAKYTVVVFDISDLDNIAYAVSDKTRNGRRVATMKQHCELELGRDGARHPVIDFFNNVPVIDVRIKQMFLENHNLHDWAAIIGMPENPILSHIFEQKKSSILNSKLGRQVVDEMFGDNLRLASIAPLTCKDVIKVVRLASKVVSLSISSKTLNCANSDLDDLVTALARLPSLVVVYIADPVLKPSDLRMFHLLLRSVNAQIRFFERVHLQNVELWKKVQGSSMYSWALNSQVRCSLEAESYKVMTEKARAFLL